MTGHHFIRRSFNALHSSSLDSFICRLIQICTDTHVALSVRQGAGGMGGVSPVSCKLSPGSFFDFFIPCLMFL